MYQEVRNTIKGIRHTNEIREFAAGILQIVLPRRFSLQLRATPRIDA
jgi:hypothetical protein